MSTRSEQILAAIVTTLNTGTPVGVPQCSRNKSIPESEINLSSIIVMMGNEENSLPAGFKAPIVHRQLEVIVEIRQAGDGVSAPETLADPLYDWSVKALCSSTLGGLVERIEEAGRRIQNEKRQVPIIIENVRFLVHFRTSRTNASAFA